MEEETLRKMAVEQYLQGKTAVSIYREMGDLSIGSSNGSVDTNLEMPIGIKIDKRFLDLTLV